MGHFIVVTERQEALFVPFRNGDGSEDPLIINLREFDREARTPSLMLKADDVLSYTWISDHAPITFHWFARSRETTKDSTTGLKGSGSNKMTDVVVVLLNDPYISSLETNMQNGEQFNQISIKQLHWVGSERPQIIWEKIFGTVRIIQIVPGKIYTAVVFRANKILTTRYQFSQADGSLAGNAPTSYNFETGQSAVDLTAAPQPVGGLLGKI